MARMSPVRLSRRGVYLVIVALFLSTLLGFGALAIDVSYIRFAQAQTQDVADAAAAAALNILRRTGDQDQAEAAAQAVVSRNLVAGREAEIDSITFGDWDPDDGTFTAEDESPNGVSVQVSRAGSNALDLMLAPVLGVDNVDLQADATAAARDLDVIVVFDVTNSWSRPNFYNATAASVSFYDVLTNAYGVKDRMGMVIFSGTYAYEFTELQRMADAEDGTVRTDWEDMETFSKAGTPANNSKGCVVHRNRSKYRKPPGGCFPHMPREYGDEYGTDHSIGMEAAATMFDNADDNGAYRAVVVLTDGEPNGTSSSAGTQRGKNGFSESRWTEYVGTGGKSASDVRSDSVQIAEDMWNDQEAHVWVISFKADASFMENMVQGDGSYTVTTDSAELEEIFVDIANSLPQAIVE